LNFSLWQIYLITSVGSLVLYSNSAQRLAVLVAYCFWLLFADQRLKGSVHINQSLLALGNVIAKLSEGAMQERKNA